MTDLLVNTSSLSRGTPVIIREAEDSRVIGAQAYVRRFAGRDAMGRALYDVRLTRLLRNGRRRRSHGSRSPARVTGCLVEHMDDESTRPDQAAPVLHSEPLRRGDRVRVVRMNHAGDCHRWVGMTGVIQRGYRGSTTYPVNVLVNLDPGQYNPGHGRVLTESDYRYRQVYMYNTNLEVLERAPRAERPQRTTPMPQIGDRVRITSCPDMSRAVGTFATVRSNDCEYFSRSPIDPDDYDYEYPFLVESEDYRVGTVYVVDCELVESDARPTRPVAGDRVRMIRVPGRDDFNGEIATVVRTWSGENNTYEVRPERVVPGGGTDFTFIGVEVEPLLEPRVGDRVRATRVSDLREAEGYTGTLNRITDGYMPYEILLDPGQDDYRLHLYADEVEFIGRYTPAF